MQTDIFQLEQVAAGNIVSGPAIVEHSATTFAIPPGRAARLDGHHIFHLTCDVGGLAMATVDQAARVEPPATGIGWDGRGLLEMLEESERLFAETGHYWGCASSS